MAKSPNVLQFARVIKVGGSLFSTPQLAARLQSWLQRFAGDGGCSLLIAGGGPLVDCIRELQPALGLTDEFCHATSLHLMSTTGRLLQQLMPDVPLVEQPDPAAPHELMILDAGRFAATHSSLPRSWETTSDSLAAEVAVNLGFRELWLLKSTMPRSPRIADWRASGYVDASFPTAACGLESVFCVNFTDRDLLSIKAI